MTKAISLRARSRAVGHVGEPVRRPRMTSAPCGLISSARSSRKSLVLPFCEALPAEYPLLTPLRHPCMDWGHREQFPMLSADRVEGAVEAFLLAERLGWHGLEWPTLTLYQGDAERGEVVAAAVAPGQAVAPEGRDQPRLDGLGRLIGADFQVQREALMVVEPGERMQPPLAERHMSLEVHLQQVLGAPCSKRMKGCPPPPCAPCSSPLRRRMPVIVEEIVPMTSRSSTPAISRTLQAGHSLRSDSAAACSAGGLRCGPDFGRRDCSHRSAAPPDRKRASSSCPRARPIAKRRHSALTFALGPSEKLSLLTHGAPGLEWTANLPAQKTVRDLSSPNRCGRKYRQFGSKRRCEGIAVQ